MYKERLKSILGIFLVSTHAGAILWVISLGRHFLEFADVVSLALIIMPMFTLHSTTVVKEFLKTQASTGRGRKVNLRYAFVVFLFPLLFAGSLASMLVGYMGGFVATVDQLKVGIGVTESAFGVYLGLVTRDIFRDVNK
jgi:hypothetical protein